jgi:hypothetical protein
MRSIDSDQASKWFKWMLKDRENPLAESTARKTVSIARQFWDKAQDQNIVEDWQFACRGIEALRPSPRA